MSPRPLMDNLAGLPLSPDETAILEAMFASCQRVTIVREFTAGLGGSRVLLVRPITSGDILELQAAVKIGPADLIEKEWRAYQDWVDKKLPDIVQITDKPAFPAGGPLGGLRYTLMGGGTFDIESLHSYYRHASAEDMRYVLQDRLFKVVASNWYRFGEGVAGWSVRAGYDRVLPVNLLIEPAAPPSGFTPRLVRPDALPDQPLTQGEYVRLERFWVTEVDPRDNTVTLNVPPRQELLPASYRLRLRFVESTAPYQVGHEMPPVEGVIVDTRLDLLRDIAQQALGHSISLTADTLTSPGRTVLPNPLAALPALLKNTRNVRVSCIHGDLNIENILVEPQGRNVSLIDFASTCRDHTLHDMLRLETEIITKLLPEALAQPSLLVETLEALYDRLHRAMSASERSSSTESFSALPDVLCEMLVAVRKMAGQCLFDPGDWTEYYEGLTLYLLGAMKFENLNQLSKRTAFWAAAVAYSLFAGDDWRRDGPIRDWSRLRAYLPVDMHQERREAVCLAHLNALLRAVLTYLPRHVARDLLLNPVVARNDGRFLEGTLLFADISGFTALSERLRQRGEKEGAEEVARLINEYLDVMLAILFRHEGRLVKFGGDSMLCLFTEGDRGAMNAVWTAWEMKQSMAEHFGELEVLQEVFPLEMKVGGNSGVLLAANVGTVEHMEYVLTGSAVERTAHAESVAHRGDILISADTYILIEDALEAEPLADVPGFYRITGLRPVPVPESEDLWAEIQAFLPLIDDDLWQVVDRLDALAPYLPAGVLPQLVYDPQGGQIEGQHRQVTVLFANFDGMSKVIHARGMQNVEHITADLGEYFQTMQEEIRYYGGVINKVDLYDQGDKLMVVFGAPQAHEKDVQRAALTALAMQEGIGQLSPLAAALMSQRIGIHTGFAFAGNVGSRACERREYTVMGDTVNLAARLMAAAPHGEIWVSERVWEQIHSAFEAMPVPNVRLKGIQAPVTAYQLSATLGVPEGRAWSRALESEVVGRESELKDLMACYEDLMLGMEKQIVAIIGQVGVGKTRLVTEWVRRAASSADGGPRGGATWLTGRGHSYGQKAYGVIVEILEALLGFVDDDSQAARWTKLRTHIIDAYESADEGYAAVFLDKLAYLGKFLSLDPAKQKGLPESIAQLDAEALQAQTRLAICDLLTHTAKSKPLVLVMEDLHWADGASLELVQFIVDQVPDHAAILFCLIYRPRRDLPIWSTWEAIEHAHADYCHTIPLKELEPVEGYQLLSNLMRNSQLPRDFQTLIMDETDGNPLYIEEVLHTLIEEGAIVRHDQVWRVVRSMDSIRVPETLHQIVQSRIDELDFRSPGARRVLWMASAVGEECSEDLLWYLFASTRRGKKEYADHIRELRNAAMLRQVRLQTDDRPQRGYRFRHGLVRQVAYENMLVEKQRLCHGQIGRWLEEQHGEDSPRHYDVLAYHYDRARQWEKAFRYHLLAGGQDAQEYANREAISHLRRALEIADYTAPSPELLAQARSELGVVLSVIGEYDEAIAHLEPAYILYGRLPGRDAALRQARVCYHIGRAYEQQGDREGLETALEWYAKGMAPLPDAPTAEAAMLHALRGIVSMRQGDFDRAVEAGRQSLQAAQAANAKSGAAFAHRMLSLAFHVQGHLDLAMEHCRQSIKVCEEVSDLIGLTRNYANQGVYAFEMDDWSLAKDAYLRGLEKAEQIGDKWEIARAHSNLGDLYCHLGEIEEGLDSAQQSLDLFETLHSMQGIISARAVLATLLLRQNRLEEALQQLHEAQALAQEAVMFKPTVGRWLAQVYLAAKDVDRVEAQIQVLQSLDVDMLADETEPIQRLRGQVLAARGKMGEATSVLEASLSRLEGQGARYQAGCTQLVLARVLAQDGRASKARDYAESARATFAELGARLDTEEADRLLAVLRENRDV